MIELGPPEMAFARGGNRLCYVDPRDDRRCIKVLRQDHDPAWRRARKRFPKNMRSLSSFDDNLQEFQVYEKVARFIGEPAWQVASRCYGFVDTTQGKGLCSELIRDDNGLIAISLKQYVWEYGITKELSESVSCFSLLWRQLGMPSRNLLLHNIVVQRAKGAITRLVVIDGLGWAGAMPLAYWLQPLARYRAGRKIQSLYRGIEQLLDKKKREADYGYHGWLTEEQRRSG